MDQARLPYRAGNVVTFSVLLLAGSYLAADVLRLFPFLILKLLFAFGCSLLPLVYIRTRRQRRMRQIEEMLPDAIDLFTRAMRAGHNIHSGLHVLAEETPEPLGGEFKKLVEDLDLGSTVGEALHSIGDRVPLLDLRFFSTGVILQRETGANIVTVMENLSAVIRERLQLPAQPPHPGTPGALHGERLAPSSGRRLLGFPAAIHLWRHFRKGLVPPEGIGANAGRISRPQGC